MPPCPIGCVVHAATPPAPVVGNVVDVEFMPPFGICRGTVTSVSDTPRRRIGITYEGNNEAVTPKEYGEKIHWSRADERDTVTVVAEQTQSIKTPDSCEVQAQATMSMRSRVDRRTKAEKRTGFGGPSRRRRRRRQVCTDSKAKTGTKPTMKLSSQPSRYAVHVKQDPLHLAGETVLAMKEDSTAQTELSISVESTTSSQFRRTSPTIASQLDTATAALEQLKVQDQNPIKHAVESKNTTPDKIIADAAPSSLTHTPIGAHSSIDKSPNQTMPRWARILAQENAELKNQVAAQSYRLQQLEQQQSLILSALRPEQEDIPWWDLHSASSLVDSFYSDTPSSAQSSTIHSSH